MKKIALVVVLLITTLSISFAQNDRGQDRKKSPEQRTDMIMKYLNNGLALSKEQFAQIREVVLQRELKREKGKLDKKDHNMINGEINKYLTKEQKEKWVAMKKQARDRKHDHKKDKDHDNVNDARPVDTPKE